MRREMSQALRVLETAARQAAARGSLLFHLDLATELARPLFAYEPGLTLVPLLDGEGYGVAAIAAGKVRGWVRFADDGQPLLSFAPLHATAVIETLARARRTVFDAQPVGAMQAVIVLPPSTDTDELTAYAIRLADRPGDVVFGRHSRLTVARDGSRIVTSEPLSDRDVIVSGQGGRPPLAAETTHQGAVPSEIHTYLSLKHGLPIEVLALESLIRWRVDGEGSSIISAAAQP